MIHITLTTTLTKTNDKVHVNNAKKRIKYVDKSINNKTKLSNYST